MSRGAQRGPQLSPHKGAAWGAGRRWGPAVQVQSGRMPLRGVQPCPASRAPSAPSNASLVTRQLGSRRKGAGPQPPSLSPSPQTTHPSPSPCLTNWPQTRHNSPCGAGGTARRPGRGDPRAGAVGSLFSNRGRCPSVTSGPRRADGLTRPRWRRPSCWEAEEPAASWGHRNGGWSLPQGVQVLPGFWALAPPLPWGGSIGAETPATSAWLRGPNHGRAGKPPVPAPGRDLTAVPCPHGRGRGRGW